MAVWCRGSRVASSERTRSRGVARAIIKIGRILQAWRHYDVNLGRNTIVSFRPINPSVLPNALPTRLSLFAACPENASRDSIFHWPRGQCNARVLLERFGGIGQGEFRLIACLGCVFVVVACRIRRRLFERDASSVCFSASYYHHQHLSLSHSLTLSSFPRSIMIYVYKRGTCGFFR